MMTCVGVLRSYTGKTGSEAPPGADACIKAAEQRMFLDVSAYLQPPEIVEVC